MLISKTGKKRWKKNSQKMTQKTIKSFIDEIYWKGPKQNYPTNKTDVLYIDDIWSLDILDLKDYGPENNCNHRYVLVVINNFSKIGWTVSIKKCSNNKRIFQKYSYSI